MLDITADSRKVKNGDIFVAVRGIDGDGHDYIDKAIQNGASKIIAEEGTYEIPYEIVDDSREYLLSYLKKHYNPKLRNVKFVGITGTNGKTTTAFLIYKALRLMGIKSAYIGTNGFYLEEKVFSLPNSSPDIWDSYDMFMQAKEDGCKYIIMEVSSHALSYNRVEGYLFDYALFTNLTQDHLDYHKTMGNYALAKQLLFKKLKKNGKAFINIDDKYKDYFLLEGNDNITYGFTGGDYKVDSYKMTAEGTTFSYEHKGIIYEIDMQLIAQYNIYNMLSAICILSEMGFADKLKEIIPLLKAPIGRMETIHYKTNSIIIDYAHTPDAVEKILKTVKTICKGKIYVAFGCTGDRDRTKRPIMLSLACHLADHVIITNDDLHFEDPKQIVADMTEGATYDNYEVCLDRKKAIIKGIDLLKENDIFLILGKGHEDAMIVGNERIPFSDKKEVSTYLQKKGTLVES
ncbi:MAG: UDP-N-acetylmuramoyl-L-alanyl-D-glutamate--2,6-diaminopimelate ligase [Bacilli bacterium]|nr:UDP-N-acetylmuramoyl-L-alanyl-D-glutamate--2,6-diaminopimelate ligase [Bacilli bacterium]